MSRWEAGDGKEDGIAGGAEERHTVVEPIPEAVKAILDKVFCCSEIEPGID